MAGVADLKIGDKFRVTNTDRPEWLAGVWEIVGIRLNRFDCLHESGKSGWMEWKGETITYGR